MNPTSAEARPRRGARGKLINIDNGGTLTDICVIDGDRVHRTKTLTTPHDLSACLLDGLRKAARTVYGTEDLQALLLSTESIRYSTTQGTNALVERKGPRLGVLLGGGLTPKALRDAEGAAELYPALIGVRAVALDAALGGEALEEAAIQAVNTLAASGASRLIVSFAGPGREAAEAALKRRLLRTFPPHLLGALPMLFTHELADDADDVRRTWTAVFNAFLHPAMEHFLYNAEHKLRGLHVQSPLLVFRNDGLAGRVAKTIAVKTYSSGPRGGMEGARALASHYGFSRLLTMDVGGTTTDIGLVEGGVVRATAQGSIEGVQSSFPLCDVVSAGVGGSSIFRVERERLQVGPQSVGSAPGPACFGLGGREATMTDAFLLGGLLDPASYFGGDLKIDVDRARAAVREQVGGPLGLDDDAAVQAMEAAWVRGIAESLRGFAGITPDTTLAAFGGAGPFVACRVADELGVSRVVIPALAAVFSAYGIGFSDVGHQFSAPLPANDDDGLATAMLQVFDRAARSMFGEGASIEDCRLTYALEVADGAGTRTVPLQGTALPAELRQGLAAGARLSLQLTAVKPVPHASITGRFGGAAVPAFSGATRTVLVGSGAGARRAALPLYRVEAQPPGAQAAGPAVLEEAFFTCRIDDGWRFEINDAGDILLSKETTR
ncbi:hydantoinase/oxoprolinase family protein [Aquincola sp. MAHUQ-54]|uniref:Hydantoinase/oxoprolinase family protein n=1 Tax=Aquincola agrisoli TaxID=3119538 RepID=A0AAW9QCK3_9BURK